MSRLAIDAALAGFADEVGAEGPVAVEGGRTRWDLGRGDGSEPRLVRAPSGIVEHLPAEMTVRVRAGTPVAELDSALAEAGQRCALPDRGAGPAGPSTVGGAVMVAENHLHSLGRGRLRDSVLEVRYVSAEGKVIIGGGPTVKNVTGFDLPRLLTGSLGTIGLLGEVVLRTNPIPAAHRWVAVTDAEPRAVRRAVLRPGAIAWDGETAWVLLEGHEPDVEAGAAALALLGDVTDSDGPPALPHRWSRTPAQQYDSPGVNYLGTGVTVADQPDPNPPTVDPGAATVAARVVANFDPTGRLNPQVSC